MRLVIVTGMSGAGKSTALKMLEDMGYFCVDNLPVPLIPKFAELLAVPGTEMNKAALGVDIRSGQSFQELANVLKVLDEGGCQYEILYLESSDDVLVKRYKETRRFHPLAGSDGRVEDGLKRERELLGFLKKKADYLVDTSHMLTRELKAELNKIFVQNKEYKNLYITVLSFGFKYGIPNDADLVFDVRFLPNPYYIEELRPMSGNDQPVRDYVMNNDTAKQFLTKLTDMVEFLIPNYISEGKTQLVIGIGCTGGKHRSVTLANELYEALKKTDSYGVRIEHRDIGKDAITKAKQVSIMSFSGKIKEELAEHVAKARHCNLAELTAILHMCGEFEEDKNGICTIRFRSENYLVARKCFTLMSKTFNIEADIVVRKNMTNGSTSYFMRWGGEELLAVKNALVQAVCCKRAYIRREGKRGRNKGDC